LEPHLPIPVTSAELMAVKVSEAVTVSW